MTNTQRPLLGLRRAPGHLALILFRMPLQAYRHGHGRLLGRTFLLLVHVGRNTGKPHETVAMVLSYQDRDHEAVICSAWGPNADWIRNLKARTASEVRIGRDSFIPEHRFLTDDEALAVALDFQRRHPWRLRLMATVLGWGKLNSDSALLLFVQQRPFVSLRPAP